MARRTVELSLVTDRDDPGPLTSQITGQLRDALADGRLPPVSGSRPQGCSPIYWG